MAFTNVFKRAPKLKDNSAVHVVQRTYQLFSVNVVSGIRALRVGNFLRIDCRDAMPIRDSGVE